MNDSSLRYALPFIQMGQAQKEIAHNEAVARIDTLLHLTVESLSISVPPAYPALGVSWIVGAGAVGAWNQQSGNIASYDGFGWHYLLPREGCLAWVADGAHFAVWTNGAWQSAAFHPLAGRIRLKQQTLTTEAGSADTASIALVDAQARNDIANMLRALQKAGILLD